MCLSITLQIFSNTHHSVRVMLKMWWIFELILVSFLIRWSDSSGILWSLVTGCGGVFDITLLGFGVQWKLACESAPLSEDPKNIVIHQSFRVLEMIHIVRGHAVFWKRYVLRIMSLFCTCQPGLGKLLIVPQMCCFSHYYCNNTTTGRGEKLPKRRYWYCLLF